MAGLRYGFDQASMESFKVPEYRKHKQIIPTNFIKFQLKWNFCHHDKVKLLSCLTHIDVNTRLLRDNRPSIVCFQGELTSGNRKPAARRQCICDSRVSCKTFFRSGQCDLSRGEAPSDLQRDPRALQSRLHRRVKAKFLSKFRQTYDQF